MTAIIILAGVLGLVWLFKPLSPKQILKGEAKRRCPNRKAA